MTTHVGTPRDRGRGEQSWRVVGVVLRADGSPVAGAMVRVRRQGLRRAEGITRRDQARTGTDGRFVYEYPRPERRLDLRVELLPDEARCIGATRPVLIAGAGQEEAVELIVNDEPYRGPSDFQQLAAAVAPILADEGLELADLDALADVERAMLSVKAGVRPAEIARIAESATLARETELPADVFYGLARQNVPLALPAVLGLTSEQRRAAVDAALQSNQIPRLDEAAVEAALRRLDELAIDRALGQTGRIGALLDLAGIPAAVQPTLVAQYAARDGDIGAFWAQVRERRELGPDQVDRLQVVLQLGAITQNHPPLVKALLERGVSEPRQLAVLDCDEWLELVEAGAGVPSSLAALDPAGYAAMIFTAVEEAFPAQMVAHRAARLDDGHLVAGFFAANPAFDLRTPLATYLREHPDAFEFAGDEAPSAARRIKGIERTYRIARPGARIATMERLLADGLDSAHKIRRLGRASFLRTYSESFGAERAQHVWARAAQASALSTTLLARHGAQLDRTPLPFLPDRLESLAAFPEYQSLFGSLDFCACEHCQSLYSPAAYLVDVLHWLGNRRAAASSASARDVLFDGRRADLGTIELSCKNTHTELPYLDLVNEVLELMVAPASEPPAYQTTGDAAALRAHPEHQREAAYAVLAGSAAGDGKDAVFPFHLPFNLWLEEARAYLGQLGVSRHALMATVLGAAAAADVSVAAESLALSPLEWDIVAGNTLAPQRSLASMWGMTSDTALVTTLVQVPAFLEAARLPDGSPMPLEELTDLLRCDFVQAAGPLGLWFDGTSCDTSRAQLIGLGTEHLARVHRFVRLRRRLGWSASDLDRAIQLLGAGELDEATLVRISHAARTSRALHLPIADQLGWWGPIDTRRWPRRLRTGIPNGVAPGSEGTGLVFDARLTPAAASGEEISPYDRQFQSASAPASHAFAVAEHGRGLLDESATLGDHTAAIAAALRVTAGDLERLVARLPDDRLSLRNLSSLSRHVAAARALGLPVGEVTTAIELYGADPFDAANPHRALALADEVRADRAKGVSIVELDYLLRHVGGEPFTPREDAVGRLLLAVRDALRTATATESAVIDRISTAVGLDAATTALLLREYLAEGGRPLLDVFAAAELRDYGRTAPGSPALTLPPAADLPVQFAAYERLHKVALVLRRFRVSTAELRWVMEIGPAHGTLDLRGLPNSRTELGAGYDGWSRLRNALGLRDRSTTGRLFDLCERAAALAGESDPDVIAIAHADLLAELESRLRWSRSELEPLIGTPTVGGVAGVPSLLGLSYPSDFADERALAHVERVIGLARRVGLGVAVLWPWHQIPRAADGSASALEAATQESTAQAAEIVQAVRARHEPAVWLGIAAALRDALRARQRDALVGWLTGNDPSGRFLDASALYEHLLLDVEMSPCQLTSRLEQAISSVQLFVQRIFLGLEVDGEGAPRVELSADDAREWAWMKSYRVWEANRKIFLYPENWLDPDLRDDKTPFFEELEAELLQGEVTSDAAEQALRTYLEKLHEVSRLQVVGIAHEDGPSSTTLHVVGRTRGTPSRYFYRQRRPTEEWTPWEAALPDIEGDQLLLAMHRGRLYAFWLQISEAAAEEVPDLPKSASDPVQSKPKRYYQVRLAWSERRAGKWSSKKVSTQQIGVAKGENPHQHPALAINDASSTSQFLLHSFDVHGDLVVQPIRHLEGVDVVDADRQYHRLPGFRIHGTDGSLTLESVGATSFNLELPAKLTTTDQAFTGEPVGLTLPTVDPLSSARRDQRLLDRTPFGVEVVPGELVGFRSERTFVFQDRERTFLVEPQYPRRANRRPPHHTQPDAIALDVDRVLPEIAPPPRLPPATTRLAEVGSTNTSLTSPPRLLRSGETGGDGGLVDLDTRWLAGIVDAGVASLGADSVTIRPNRLAVRSSITINDAGGDELVSVRSAQPPAESAGLRTLTVSTTYTMPAHDAAVPDGGLVIGPSPGRQFQFESFYHPFAARLGTDMDRDGKSGLFDPTAPDAASHPALQSRRDEFFEATYAPKAILRPYPVDQFDFSHSGAYAQYNWELFFHLPLLVATHLSRNQRFEDAQRWLHAIFDPTAAGGGVQGCWKVRPFYEQFYGEDAEAGPIHELLLLLHYAGDDPAKLRARAEVVRQVAAWRRHPFEPHALARLRPTAYLRAVIMAYVDNLIDWADQLFRRDTMESVNEATQLYVLAAQILGERPREVTVSPPAPRTFDELRAAGLDELGNALVEEIEAFLPDGIADDDSLPQIDDPPVLGPTLYFCVPPNERLLTGYWERVADRLFKLRHCMNLEGVVRALPLFEPPIDPGLLVRAQASGLDLGSAMAAFDAPAPRHRYAVLAHKAKELCGDVRALGQALLSVMERRDGEELALMRAGHEASLLSSMREVRVRQIAEARETVDSLRRSRENAQLRQRYYQSRTLMNGPEAAQLGLLYQAGLLDFSAGAASLGGVTISAVPNTSVGTAGFGGTPFVVAEYGGSQGANVTRSMADYLKLGAMVLDRAAHLSGLVGSYLRRKDDWDLQAAVAAKEIQALDKQLVAAEIRVAIAERERDNLDLQRGQADEVESFLRQKYTNAALYHWMVGQLSAVYFQSYQLAHELAVQAERAWQRELAEPDRTFIELGYWDSLKKGLLAGDRLHLDLQRMETAYLDRNVREHELTRHVSLRELDPLALLALRTSGECLVRIPEEWLDLDSPGHYLRRLKTVSLSVPSVTGPYAPVRCTLTLLRSTTRVSSDPATSYRRSGPDDGRFRDDVTAIESIVTSHGVEDAGLFETNLRDERYLPFEGAGAISEWRLELPNEFRTFDYETISDVVLHLRYTARPGGAALRHAAESELRSALRELVLGSEAGAPAGQREGLLHLVSARRDAPDEWARWLTPPDDQPDQVLALALSAASLPFALRNAATEILGVDLLVPLTRPGDLGGATLTLDLGAPGQPPRRIDLTSTAGTFGGVPHGHLDLTASPAALGEWTIAFRETDNPTAPPAVVTELAGHRRLDAAALVDLVAVFRYRQRES